jgi:hypothetical protein
MPLRPDLYQRLNGRSLGPVIIAAEGVAMRVRVIEEGRGQFRLHLDEAGEYYRIRCPFCKESKYRLWINHRWGLFVPKLRSDNLHLAHCFNEDCLSVPGHALKLRDWVYNDVVRGHHHDPLLPGRITEATSRDAEPPGFCVNLAKLPFEHPVVSYIRRRGQDPIQLGRDYSVGYVELADTRFMAAQGRLYIPIHKNDAFMGWQTRWPHMHVPEGVPKYYSLPGMKKNELLYNYDRARQHEFVVICEGPSDVWSFGPEAVALFGKSMSARQVEMIREGGWSAAVIMLDEDALHKKVGSFSAVEKVQAALTQIHGLAVAVVRLPPGKDPGDYDSEYLRAFVAARTGEHGLKLPI